MQVIRLVLPQFFPAIVVSLMVAASAYCATAESEEPVNSNPFSDAHEARLAVESSDENFAASITDLMQALDQTIERVPFTGADSTLSAERQSLVLLSDVTDRILGQSEVVLAAQGKYLETGQQFLADLQNAAPKFQEAAGKCRSFAAAEPYSDHRQSYLAMADIFEAMASRCERLPDAVLARANEVKELYPHLENGRTVLIRFRHLLGAMPVLKSSQEFDALDESLRNYARTYEQFRGSLLKLRDRLHDERPSSPPGNVAVKLPGSESGRRQTGSTQIYFAKWQDAYYDQSATVPSQSKVEHVLAIKLKNESFQSRPRLLPFRLGSTFNVTIPGYGSVPIRVAVHEKNGSTDYWLAEVCTDDETR